jgi:hypothetical protein
MAKLREIRDRQAEQMKGKSIEEQLEFLREQAEKFHLSGQEKRS